MNAIKLAAICVIIATVVAFLIIAKGLIIPFVIAVLVWYIINALAHRLGEIPFVRKYFPKWTHLLLSALLITFVLIVIARCQPRSPDISKMCRGCMRGSPTPI